jgi:flagellar motility protein MotE (MotC chaperone)
MMALHLSLPRLLPTTIVVMLLLLSAKAVTFAKDAGAALGITSGSTPSVSVADPAEAENSVSVPALAMKLPPTTEVSKPERALLQDLRKRREQLDAREHALEERNSVMEATAERLQEKIDHLSQMQDHLDQLEAARKQRQNASWGGLVKVYETMKPRDAGAIFNVLDMHVLLEVVDRMNERKAAAVLAAMEPERARLTTQMLAQMRLRRDTLGPSADPETTDGSKIVQ